MITKQKGLRLADAALRTLLALLFLVAAGMKFASVQYEVSGFTFFGYAMWFMYLIGSLELTGSILLLIPGCAAFGALLLSAVMVGAAWTLVRVGAPLSAVAQPVVLLLVLAGIAFARRNELLIFRNGKAAPERLPRSGNDQITF